MYLCDCASHIPPHPQEPSERHCPECPWWQLDQAREAMEQAWRAYDDTQDQVLSLEMDIVTLRLAILALLSVLDSQAVIRRAGFSGADAMIAHARRALERVPEPAWYHEETYDCPKCGMSWAGGVGSCWDCDHPQGET